MTDREMTERALTIQGLRDLADFLAAHPAVPMSPHHLNEFVDTRDEWDAIRVAAAGFVLIPDENFFVLRKVFAGGVVLDVNVDRPSADDDAWADTIQSLR